MVVILDDILVAGASKEEHLQLLDEVLQRIQRAGLRLQKKKCLFLASEVTYLGYRISADGVQPLED